MKLQVVTIALFYVFHMVYYFIDQEFDCVFSDKVLRLGMAFYTSLYIVIGVMSLYHALNAFNRIVRAYFWLAVVYFGVLVLLNIISFIWLDLYGPLISKTGLLTIPFVVLNFGLIILKIKKP